MARKSRNQGEGRSRITRGRKRYQLEESEREEELRRFLRDGADFETAEADEKEDHQPADGEVHRAVHTEPAETFGSMGQYWLADS